MADAKQRQRGPYLFGENRWKRGGMYQMTARPKRVVLHQQTRVAVADPVEWVVNLLAEATRHGGA